MYHNGTNVGIGTTDVSEYKLNVNGGINASGTISGGTLTGGTATITGGNLSGVGTIGSGAITTTGTLTFSGVATDIITGTNEHLSLMPNGAGNVGIGTTDPGAPLEVKGTGTGAIIAKFTDVNTTGCTLATGGTISCSSDRNLKKNIEDINYGLDTLMVLRPVNYNWKSEAEGTIKSLGFIAQEVETVIPNLVTTDSSNGQKQLNTIGIVPILVKSIQQQQQQINELKTVYQTDAEGYLVMPKIKVEKIIVNDELTIHPHPNLLPSREKELGQASTFPSPIWGEARSSTGASPG